MHFRSESYMGLIRNLQRYGWLIPYLFGASPAVCKSFLQGRPTDLDGSIAPPISIPTAPLCGWGISATRTARPKALG